MMPAIPLIMILFCYSWMLPLLDVTAYHNSSGLNLLGTMQINHKLLITAITYVVN